MGAVWEIYKDASSKTFRSISKLPEQDLIIQYLASFSKAFLLEFVIGLQSNVTINVITGVSNLDLLKQAIKILDVLYWVNDKFKRPAD
jgi:hypothetical protein